jgi:Carboxypeptidase regulatory-like domain
MVRGTAALAGVCLAVTGIIGQQPSRDGERPRTGTASIAGVITRSDHPKGPLRRARVTVSGSALTAPRLDTTDDQGRFDIGGLPPGQYSVSASKPAYLAMNFGATRPRRQGTTIALADGQRVANVALALPRGAAIAGVVTNRVGEPMQNAYVTLLHRRMYNGERQFLGAASGGLTNDQGEYRAFGLSAGEYLVVAQAFADVGLPAEITQLAVGDVDRALLDAQQPARVSAAPSQAARQPRLGFAPVFHPGTTHGGQATTVNVAQGEERSGVDIRLDLVATARIDGDVTSGDGTPLPALQVTLTALGPPTAWEEYGYGRRLGPRTPDAQGKFSFAGVPPGE